MKSVDFQNSFFSWKTHQGSIGRFDIDTVLTTIDKKTNKTEQAFSLSPVYACDVYGVSPLFYSPSFLYHPIFFEEKVQILRTHIPLENKDSIEPISRKFKEIKSSVRYIFYQKINKIEELRRPILEGKRFISKVSVSSEVQEQVLIFPIKHINIHETENKFQVETGIVLALSDFSKKQDKLDLVPAYIAFNSFDEANFLFLGKQQIGFRKTIRTFNKIKTVKAKIEIGYVDK